MRRPGRLARLAPLVALAALAAACAAPDLRLGSRFVAGEVRLYRVVAEAEVTISAVEASSTERTRLEATARVAVERVTRSGATLALTITPTRLVRDGRAAGLPPEQEVRVEVGPTGTIDRVTPLAGTGDLDAAEVEDLVPLIGPPLPSGRVHLADRWSRAIPGPAGAPAGVQEARLAALRVVDGRDCAIVALSTRRPVAREREIAGTTLRLEGIEVAAGEVAFAFREGFPVRVRSDAEARLAISGGPAQGGGVVIRSRSAVTLARRSVPR